MRATYICTKGDQTAQAPRLREVEPLRIPAVLLGLLAEQAGRCAVCAEELVVAPNAPDELTGVIDRDSLTQAVRGLLCRRCHDGLTLFGADPALLRRAASYLHVDSGWADQASAMAVGPGAVR